jgi:hypothetical protein
MGKVWVTEWILKVYGKILAMATNNVSLNNVVLLEVVLGSSYAFTFAFHKMGILILRRLP